MSAEFVHLRLHSEYSIVDGLINLDNLMPAVKSSGMAAVALTDESNLFGVIKFYKAAIKQGVKPIIGADIWIEGEEKEGHYRLTLLCQNYQGYHNLMLLISKAYLSGERDQGVPILQRMWLTRDSLQGLIALSGAQEGDIGYSLLHNQDKRAEIWLKNWLVLFPQNRFYIELQRTDRPNEQVYTEAVLPLAVQYQVPIVATQDVRFLKTEEFTAHEIRVAIHDGYTMDDSNRPKKYRACQYLMSSTEMIERFADLPEAIENTVEIAKRCTVKLDLDKPQLPAFPVPESMTEGDFLRQLSKTGLDERFTAMHLNEEQKNTYRQRLDIELDVIIKMGFSGYFLIVADFIQWSKRQDIPVGPGRGSGAGSLVAYALKITDLDPLPYDLLFERFLNPERVSMPDFDIDFCMDGRDRVIDYVAERYGRNSVSQIATFGTMAAKAVVRDVGRVLALPYGFVDSIAKLIPMDLGMTLDQALKDEPQLKARYENEDDVKSVIDMGLTLEGTVRNVGKHAGGVVIAPTLLTDFCPIYCEEGTNHLVAQFDKNDVESAGLVKFDFLGLRNLTIIHQALKIVNTVKRNKGETEIDINLIPLNDPATFKLLKRCETTAVFQLESRGMKDLIRRLQPDTFEDIIALVALFRPGPLQSGMVDDFIDRKHGRAIVEYPHPDIADALKPTYGIILYQEQVMLIAQILAGFSLGAADLLRRAMGKKKAEEMALQRESFVKGAVGRGVEEATATYIFDLMEKFAGYGFNKSHSAAYALVSYQTAWLKTHYPDAFMAAVLSSDMDNTDKVVNFVEDCELMNIGLLSPDINISQFRFTAENGKVRYGLGAVKGAGEAAIESIVVERNKNGNFKDLFDFCQRVDLRKVNKRVMDALIYSGAMDALAPSRESALASLDKATQIAEQAGRDQESGQNDLFAIGGDTPVMPAVTAQFVPAPVVMMERLFKEKAVLGHFMSNHPLTELKHELKSLQVKSLKELSPTKKSSTLRIAGLVTSIRRLKTKRGDWMRILQLEDSKGRCEVTVFADLADRLKFDPKVNEILLIEAEVSEDQYSGGLRVGARDIMSLDQARGRYAKALRLTLNHTQLAALNGVEGLKGFFKPYLGGTCPVIIHYQNATAGSVLKLGNAWMVNPTGECLAGLRSAGMSVELVY